MLEDWRNVDLNSITKQTLYTMEDSQEEHRQIIIQRESTAGLASQFCPDRSRAVVAPDSGVEVDVLAGGAVYQEFDRLLEEQSPIEAYIEWLDSMVDRCVVKVSHFRTHIIKTRLRRFNKNFLL